MAEAETDLDDYDFDKFRKDSSRELMAGELVSCSEPDEPGDHVLVENRYGEELWVHRTFIKWEGRA